MEREQSNAKISVDCHTSADGWTCVVKVGTGEDVTEHEVQVSREELDRLAPQATEATPLVAASFAYLLEHEPKESILPRFGVRTIASYFPDYPEEIRRRLEG